MPYDMPIYDYDEERDGKHCWLSGAQWDTPPWTPLFTELWYTNASWLGINWGYDRDCLPTSKGWNWKVKNGRFYITVLLTTEEERKAREPIWRQRMAPVFDDPFGHWAGLREEMVQLSARLSQSQVNMEKMTNMELMDNFYDCWNSQRRVNQIHHWPMGTFNQALLLFQIMLGELTGIPAWDPKFSKLVAGFDNSILQSNKGLAELATSAMELKLEDKFKLPDQEVLAAMEQSDAGKQWLGQLQEYLKVWGLRRARCIEFCTPTWIEQPDLAIPEIKHMMATGGAHAPELQRERLIREREDTEKEVLAMVPEGQRDWFEKLMRCAQTAGIFSEDHVYWVEFNPLSPLRLAAMEAARRFVRGGTMETPDDIFYLLHYEIVHALQLHNDMFDMRPLVNRRREEYQRSPFETPIVIGDVSRLPELTAADPIFNVGISPQIAKPEEVGATLVGAAGAPGVAEGIARVVYGPEQLGELQQGEVLVAIFTNPAWTPAFGVVKAVVTDVGGALAHAAIVGREYGIPVVVGTMEATQKIKSGQKVRVDGNMLRVYVIE